MKNDARALLCSIQEGIESSFRISCIAEVIGEFKQQILSILFSKWTSVPKWQQEMPLEQDKLAMKFTLPRDASCPQYIWNLGSPKFIYEFMNHMNKPYESICEMKYEFIVYMNSKFTCSIHIHVNSYMKWSFEFIFYINSYMNSWLYKFKCKDSEFVFEFNSIECEFRSLNSHNFTVPNLDWSIGFHEYEFMIWTLESVTENRKNRKWVHHWKLNELSLYEFLYLGS